MTLLAEAEIVYHLRDGRIYTTQLGAGRIENMPWRIARAKILGTPVIVCTDEQMRELDESFDDMKSSLQIPVPSE